MNRTDIMHKLGEIASAYKFGPKTKDTLQIVAKEMNAFLDPLKPEWKVSVNLWTVDGYAFFAQVMIQHETESRYTLPEIIWVEEEAQVKGDDDAYDRAMGVIV